MKDWNKIPTIELEAMQFEASEDEDCLLGAIRLGPVDMHVMALRVEWLEDDSYRPTKDPYGRLDDFQTLDEGVFQTTEIPGFEGHYIIVAHPFCD